MERAIKFRAWDKTDKFMMDDVYFRRVDLSKIPFKRSVEGPRWTVNLECEDIIIMQFTGLLDKNGREIYEGDILKSLRLVLPITVDDFHGYRFRFGKDNLCRMYAEEGEIIGNIYENSDLLE